MFCSIYNLSILFVGNQTVKMCFEVEIKNCVTVVGVVDRKRRVPTFLKPQISENLIVFSGSFSVSQYQSF